MNDFNMKIRLCHRYGRWHVEVTGDVDHEGGDEAFRVRPERQIGAEDARW